MVGCSSRYSSLTDDEIHVWTARFVDDESLTSGELTLLAADECARGARLVQRRDRMRFIQFHAFARRVLGGYLGIPAAEVRLAAGRNGKPRIEHPATDPELHFNISHSGDCCLLAARLGSAVGIDIEQVRDMPDALAVARRFFTRSEAELLAGLDGDARRDAFFALWTHKEAAVKALGEGLANLERVEFVRDPAGHPQAISFAVTGAAPDGLWVKRLDASAGHVAALASLHPYAKIMSYACDEVERAASPSRERAAPSSITRRYAPAPPVRSREALHHPRGA